MIFLVLIGRVNLSKLWLGLYILQTLCVYQNTIPGHSSTFSTIFLSFSYNRDHIHGNLENCNKNNIGGTHSSYKKLLYIYIKNEDAQIAMDFS